MTLSPDFPLGDSLEVFVRREDAERSSPSCATTNQRWRRSWGSRSASWSPAAWTRRAKLSEQRVQPVYRQRL